jgi:urease accessory protein UreE
MEIQMPPWQLLKDYILIPKDVSVWTMMETVMVTVDLCVCLKFGGFEMFEWV